MGAWQGAYTEHGFCHRLAAGQMRMRGDDGSETMAVAGGSSAIPAGFEDTGEELEPVRKLYAVHEPAI